MRVLLIAAAFGAITMTGCGQASQEGPTKFVIQPSDVESAQLHAAENAVEIKLTPSKAAAFTKMTEQNIGKTVPLYFGDELISEPEIRAVIEGGTVIIQRDSKGAAQALLDTLK